MDWTEHAEPVDHAESGDPFEDLPITAILRARAARSQDPPKPVIILETTPDTNYRHPPMRVRLVKVPVKRVEVVSKLMLGVDATFLLASLVGVVYNLVLYGWLGMSFWGVLVFFVLTLRQLRVTTRYVEKEVVEDSPQRRS